MPKQREIIGASESEIAAAQEAAEKLEQARKTLAEAGRALDKSVPEGHRVFITYSQFANAHILVKSGEPVYAPVGTHTPLGMRPVSHREGDKWAVFQGGVLVTDDPDIIAWCESHPEICRDASDPFAAEWAELKSAQLPTNTRDEMLPRTIDVDKLIDSRRKVQQEAG